MVYHPIEHEGMCGVCARARVCVWCVCVCVCVVCVRVRACVVCVCVCVCVCALVVLFIIRRCIIALIVIYDEENYYINTNFDITIIVRTQLSANISPI